MKFKTWKREREGHESKTKLFNRLEEARLKKLRAKRKIKNKISRASRKKNR